MNKLYLVLLLILLVPSCSPNRIHTKKERKKLNHQTSIRIDQSLDSYVLPKRNMQENNFHAQGLSLQDAIAIAFEYNSGLNADLESLGIAKADLVQAGLLTNPFLETEYKTPRPRYHNEHTKVELNLSFTISDLWQVPRRKKVAEDELEITSMRILNTIINLFADTKIAYYNALHAAAHLEIAQRIYDESIQLKERFIYRQQLGYSSELDTSLAEVMTEHWKIEVIQAENNLYTAYRELEQILGIESDTRPLNLTGTFNTPDRPLPSLVEVESYAFEHRPDLQISRLRIKRAKDLVSYEQSRFIPSVECGLSYEREADKKKLSGTLLNITLPLFDTNYAQVARARAQVKQLEQEYDAVAKATMTTIKQLHHKYEALEKTNERYNAMMPAYKKALAYITKHMKNMQFTMLTVYQTQITYHNEQSKALFAQLELLNTKAQLEKTIGKELTTSSSLQTQLTYTP